MEDNISNLQVVRFMFKEAALANQNHVETKW